MMQRIRFALLAALSCTLLMAASCGGGGGSSSPSTSNSGGGGSSPVSTTNAVAVTVNAGISPVFGANGAFVSVTVCQPGTTTCVTVPNVLLDTGSVGLRLLSSSLSGITLTNVTSGGTTLANCLQYVDGNYSWGPVATADVKLGDEVASSVPIQIIAESDDAFPSAPASCGATDINSTATLGTNGFLGVGFNLQDCGSNCVTNAQPGFYYACGSSSCTETTAALAQQVQNPVSMFAADNNGVMLTLANVPAGGAASSSGALTFGINTQTDNALGSATILTPNADGHLSTTFNGTTTQAGFIDSGSNGLYFLNSATSGIQQCTGTYTEYYCPPNTEALTATNTGNNGATSTVSFSVANAQTLFSGSNKVFPNLAGTGDTTTVTPNFLFFSWGMPFFFGRSVYLAFEGQTVGGTAGPYWAY